MLEKLTVDLQGVVVGDRYPAGSGPGLSTGGQQTIVWPQIGNLVRLGLHVQRTLVRAGASVLLAVSRHRTAVGRAAHLGPRGLPGRALTQQSGATEQFAVELRAMRQMAVSPELISDIDTELRWGLIWHDFERAMQAEIDKAFAPYLDAMTECADFDDLRDLVGLGEPVPA